MTDAMLALPAGPVRRSRALTVATLMAIAAGVSLFGGLIAAYLSVRADTVEWPPKGIKFDNYTATTLTLTLLMASVTVEWGIAAVRRGVRGQSLFGLGLTVFLGLAFLNAAWYLLDRTGFGPGDHAYGTLFFTMVVLAAVNVAVAMAYVLVAMMRVAGHQASSVDDDQLRAAGWYWQFAVVAWVAVYAVLYLLK